MNRERVQMLRDMISGIPDERIDLDKFIRGDGTPCGTIACIAGWASIYPPFRDLGFKRHGSWTEFFGLPKYSTLFSVNRGAEPGTHKQIALRRLDALLK